MPPIRQPLFLARIRRQGFQFAHCRLKEVALAFGFGDRALKRRGVVLGGAPGGMKPGDFGGLWLQAAKGIEQPPVLAGIDQRPVIVLAMNFD